MTATLRIRLPTAPPAPASAAPTFTVDGPLAGLRVGLRHEGSWRSWMLITDVWQRLLAGDDAEPVMLQTGERVGAEGEATRQAVEEWVGQIDCAVSGLGTCGSCTSWSVADAVSVEAGGKPAVVAVTAEFETHARNMAAYLGHGDLKVLVLPYPLEARPEEELHQIADDFYPQFLDLVGAKR
ncbi:MAG TPA: hypothetical protein VHT49_01750 [Acidimicrobiales bacterium]|jgi:hypothetical protein|nr:hypothetical protein [Acidimicrobiales bacterium]